MNSPRITDKRKPTQGGLRGVLDYIQTARNLIKGDPIAPLKVDPLIRLNPIYNKIIHHFQVVPLKDKKYQLKGEQS